MKVSAIIPTYNRKSCLLSCLDSLLKQDYDDLEVIVIDDASNDPLHIQNSEIKTIVNDTRFGPSHSRNVGILESNGKYILFLDSDIEFVRTDTITRMVDVLEQNEVIGQVGGEIRLPDKRAFGFNIDVTGRTHKTHSECDYLATCNCMQRRDVVLKIGGFDPYFIYTGEDKDFGYRIKKLGYKNIVKQETSVIHKLALPRLDKNNRMFHNNRLRFIRKHYNLSGLCLSLINEFLNFHNPSVTLRTYPKYFLELVEDNVFKDRNRNFLCHKEIKKFRKWFIERDIGKTLRVV